MTVEKASFIRIVLGRISKRRGSVLGDCITEVYTSLGPTARNADVLGSLDSPLRARPTCGHC